MKNIFSNFVLLLLLLLTSCSYEFDFPEDAIWSKIEFEKTEGFNHQIQQIASKYDYSNFDFAVYAVAVNADGIEDEPVQLHSEGGIYNGKYTFYGNISYIYIYGELYGTDERGLNRILLGKVFVENISLYHFKTTNVVLNENTPITFIQTIDEDSIIRKFELSSTIEFEANVNDICKNIGLSNWDTPIYALYYDKEDNLLGRENVHVAGGIYSYYEAKQGTKYITIEIEVYSTDRLGLNKKLVGTIKVDKKYDLKEAFKVNQIELDETCNLSYNPQ